jgi:hypothetical protein
MLEHLAALATAGAAIIAAGVSYWNTRKIREVHVSINSRMDAWLRAAEHVARAEGIAQGRQDAHSDLISSDKNAAAKAAKEL